MYKIVCTNDKEKRDWIEASQKLNEMRNNLDQASPVIRFLTSLYREPGEIEVYDDGLRITKPKFRPKSRHEHDSHLSNRSNFNSKSRKLR
jgi:hypothetical protein